MLMSKLPVPRYARVLYVVSNVFLCGFSELPCSFSGILWWCYDLRAHKHCTCVASDLRCTYVYEKVASYGLKTKAYFNKKGIDEPQNLLCIFYTKMMD